jgi:hypothetical protein
MKSRRPSPAHAGCILEDAQPGSSTPRAAEETETMPNTNKLALALMLLLPAIACDLEGLPGSDRSAITADSDGRRPDARRPGPPPPLVLLERAVAVGELQEDPEMSAALAAMEAAHDDARAAGEDLRLALADAVAADTVTADAVTREVTLLGEAARTEGAALEAALDTAHALLDAELRAEAVDGLPEPPPAPEAGQAPPSGGRPAGAPTDGAPQPPTGPGDGGPQALLEALELDESQRAALREALGEPERPEPPAPLELAAFADEGFEAASLGLAELHAAHVTERATRHVELLVALVPLLDDDQRSTLEDLLSEPPPEPTRSARG